MTEKELQTQINFLVSELKILRDDYTKLSKAKNLFYEMWQKADDRAERYGKTCGGTVVARIVIA